jgi:hypothetical protein
MQNTAVNLPKTLVCEDAKKQEEEKNNQPLPDYLAQSRAAAAIEL